MSDLADNLHLSYPPIPLEMSEGERLTRAREAWISAHRPFRWIAKRIRAGKCDSRLRSILFALEDLRRPMTAIIANRDEATVALIMRSSVGVPQTPDVAAALLTAVRMGRRG